jgi:GntR family transcriptional regulator, transcriptional repressor for pyruvate dehydrogenase complex
MFQEIKQKKITHRITSQIRAAILQEKLVQGDKLPSEKDMVEQFNVSKHTLREAMRALEEMGFIEMRKGVAGGAYVVKVGIHVAQGHLVNYLYSRKLTPSHLSDLRKLIEPHAARIVAKTITDDQLQFIKNLNDEARFNLENGHLEKAISKEYALHRYIADLTENPLLILIVDFAESAMKDYKKYLGADETFYATVLKHHERIYQALEARDGEKAAEEMLEHVTQVEENLIALEGVAGMENVNALAPFWENQGLETSWETE